MSGSYQQAAQGILNGLGIANPNAVQMALLEGWIAAENIIGIPNNNPLNTAWSSGADPIVPPGITGNWNYNGGNPVSIFATLQDGINATIVKLNEPFASPIVQAIKNSAPGAFLAAVADSHWGTNPATLAQTVAQAGPGVPGQSEPAIATSSGPGATNNQQVSQAQASYAASQGASTPNLPPIVIQTPFGPVDISSPFGGLARIFWVAAGIIIIIVGLWLMVEGSRE